MPVVYDLQCDDGTRYVGSSNRLESRIEEHLTGNGSEWTKLHPVSNPQVRAMNVSRENQVHAESVRTAELMLQHGVNRVRGAEHIDSAAYTRKDENHLVRSIGHVLDRPFVEVREILRRDRTFKENSRSRSRSPDRRQTYEQEDVSSDDDREFDTHTSHTGREEDADSDDSDDDYDDE